ncbi:MAG: GNAT family N-acetyltransferase [Spirochaetes bacterium]|nr:GNAT family N-acetyltransferase [Spirochaetota bacterium]
MPLLEDKNLLLRPFKKQDVPDIARFCNNSIITDNVRDFFPKPYSETDALDFIDICSKEDPQTTFAIEYDNLFAGSIGLVPKDDVHRLSAEIGYWLGEPFHNRGIMTHAVKLITEYGFSKLNIIRIFSGVFEFNLASRRVLEKSGFKLESIAEKAIIKNGVICDEYRYVLINSRYKLKNGQSFYE